MAASQRYDNAERSWRRSTRSRRSSRKILTSTPSGWGNPPGRYTVSARSPRFSRTSATARSSSCASAPARSWWTLDPERRRTLRVEDGAAGLPRTLEAAESVADVELSPMIALTTPRRDHARRTAKEAHRCEHWVLFGELFDASWT